MNPRALLVDPAPPFLVEGKLSPKCAKDTHHTPQNPQKKNNQKTENLPPPKKKKKKKKTRPPPPPQTKAPPRRRKARTPGIPEPEEAGTKATATVASTASDRPSRIGRPEARGPGGAKTGGNSTGQSPGAAKKQRSW